MKKAILTILVCLLSLSGWAQFPKMYAHRGCWSMTPSNEFIIPENSIPAVAMAKRMGYEGIECDVHYTKDNAKFWAGIRARSWPWETAEMISPCCVRRGWVLPWGTPRSL